eukprot:3556556-Amphidinium_carterae.1
MHDATTTTSVLPLVMLSTGLQACLGNKVHLFVEFEPHVCWARASNLTVLSALDDMRKALQ